VEEGRWPIRPCAPRPLVSRARQQKAPDVPAPGPCEPASDARLLQLETCGIGPGVAPGRPTSGRGVASVIRMIRAAICLMTIAVILAPAAGGAGRRRRRAGGGGFRGGRTLARCCDPESILTVSAAASASRSCTSRPPCPCCRSGTRGSCGSCAGVAGAGSLGPCPWAAGRSKRRSRAATGRRAGPSRWTSRRRWRSTAGCGTPSARGCAACWCGTSAARRRCTADGSRPVTTMAR
jgi:hypothetical protein